MSSDNIINEAKNNFQKSIQHLKQEFAQIQAGQANPALLENIMIDAYGTNSPLKNNAAISAPEPQCIAVQPWDKSLLSAIEKAIREQANGLNPVDDGTGYIRVQIPMLTEERRRELVKVIHQKSEEARVGVRKHRQDALNDIRAMDGISEDLIKQGEEELQEEVKKANAEIEDLTKKKEAETMKV